MSTVSIHISERIATITMNRPKSLNSFTPEDYDGFANALRDIDAKEEVLVTVWQGSGEWFCAGTDVRASKARPYDPNQNPGSSLRNHFKTRVVSTTTDCSRALYSHSKILVAALNGPVMGISAAFLGYFDFIYALPNVWLAVPFTFLGLVAEGGASVSFVNRMGLGVANEVLIWGKKKNAEELHACGFVNKIFPSQTTSSFHASIRHHLLEEIRDLDPIAILVVKSLIKRGLYEKNDFDAVNLRESYAQAERFASGLPRKQFMRIANKEVKHKL